MLGLSPQALVWIGSLGLKLILHVDAAAGWLFQEVCRGPSVKPLNSALGCGVFYLIMFQTLLFVLEGFFSWPVFCYLMVV